MKQGLPLSLKLADQQVPGIPCLCSSPLFPTTTTQDTGWHHHVWLLTWVHPCSGSPACAAALVWLSHPLQPHRVIFIGKLSPCQAVLARRKSYKDWKGRREDTLERVAGVLGPVSCGPQGHRGQGPHLTRLHVCAKQRYCTEQRESLLGFQNSSSRLYWGGETAPTEQRR